MRDGNNAMTKSHKPCVPIEGVVHRGNQRNPERRPYEPPEQGAGHHVPVQNVGPVAAAERGQRGGSAGCPHRISQALLKPDVTHAGLLEQRHESPAGAREEHAMTLGGLRACEIDCEVHVTAVLAVVDEVKDRQKSSRPVPVVACSRGGEEPPVLAESPPYGPERVHQGKGR